MQIKINLSGGKIYSKIYKIYSSRTSGRKDGSPTLCTDTSKIYSQKSQKCKRQKSLALITKICLLRLLLTICGDEVTIITGCSEVVAKVIFLHLFVILFTGGVCLSACWDTTTPRADTPQEQTPPKSRHPPPLDG